MVGAGREGVGRASKFVIAVSHRHRFPGSQFQHPTCSFCQMCVRAGGQGCSPIQGCIILSLSDSKQACWVARIPVYPFVWFSNPQQILHLYCKDQQSILGQLRTTASHVVTMAVVAFVGASMGADGLPSSRLPARRACVPSAACV